MEPHLPLHESQVQKLTTIINRTHTLIHFIASVALLYYRINSFLYPTSTVSIPFLPWLLIFVAELTLFSIWFLNSAYGFRPVTRKVFPERLPKDEHLPPIDVFICTADPVREPVVKVMNTVLSAMALDYMPEKLAVYVSDDAGCYGTLLALREAWGFGKLWLPFCRRYGVETRCPAAYFKAAAEDGGSNEVVESRKKIQREYEQFVQRVNKAGEEAAGVKDSKYRLPVIEIMHDDDDIHTMEPSEVKMPLLVYVSREKKPSFPHHFKAGALNVLLRVSGVISNSPFILILDCDMYSSDPSSARQAMCFHLDPKISPTLAFVQFPQKFHNISKIDIYDSSMRSILGMRLGGMDGLKGPVLCGTNFYIKRKALYGTDAEKGAELLQLQQSFGHSNAFVKSVTKSSYGHNVNYNEDVLKSLQLEAKLLASCSYENHTEWGKQIGFWYNCVVEDYFTSFMLHCNGWTSVFYNPSKPAFLGTATTNLNDTLVQGRRWNAGLLDVLLSRFCPIFYGLTRMPLLMTMCYGYFGLQPLYCIPVWILSIIPQLCLLNQIPIFPKVSSSWFILYSFVFLSSLFQYLFEVLDTGGSVQAWWIEWRVWMLKSITSYLYGTIDVFFALFGTTQASFTPTNKVDENEQFQLYQKGIYDFRTSTVLLVPLVTLLILNMASFTLGLISGDLEESFGQIFLSFFILIVNYPLLEAMSTRKGLARIPLYVTQLSVLLAVAFWSLGSIILLYI